MHTLGSWLMYPTAMGPVWAVLVTLGAVPIANEVVQRAKGTRAQSLYQGIALFLLKIPAVGAVIVKIPALGEALYVLAPKQKVDLPRPWLQVAIDSKKVPPVDPLAPAPDVEVEVEKKSAATTVVAPALLPLFFASLVLSACAPCNLPANVGVPKCVLEHNLVSCGEVDGYALLPIAFEVAVEVVSKTFNADALVTALEQQGVKDAPCVLAALKTYVGISSLPNRDEMTTGLHEAMIVSLKRKGMHGKVTVKLHNGSTESAVLP